MLRNKESSRKWICAFFTLSLHIITFTKKEKKMARMKIAIAEKI